MLQTVFNEFALLLSLTVLVGFFATKLRQPLILSFMIVGIIAGPHVMGWITSHSQIEILSSLGVTLLLFIVGLRLDIDAVKSYGAVIVALGLGQIILTGLFGFGLGWLSGLVWQDAAFVAIALAFSSTIIIVKVLSDKNDIDSLYGRMAVGVLIVQDLVVVISIIVLSSLSVKASRDVALGLQVTRLVLHGLGFFVVIALISRLIFPFLLNHIARNRELLILFAFTWAAVLAVAAQMLGFSHEVGGFLAGVSLASSHYRESIASRLEVVRNFLLLFTFLNLGAILRLDAFMPILVPTIVLSLFVLIGKPLIVMSIMGVQRFRKRTSFLTGLSLGQVSEFSLILASLGLTLGIIDKQAVSLVTFVALITIALSMYFIALENSIYKVLCRVLTFFERKTATFREDGKLKDQFIPFDVIIFGYGRHGEHIAKILETYKMRILGIDFDPRRVSKQYQHNIVVHYGDAQDADYIRSLPLSGVKWVLSTIESHDVNALLVEQLKQCRYKGKIALSAYHEVEHSHLKKLHPDLIIVPYQDAALAAANRLRGEMA